ncbi:MAG: type II toxin-antitoxin system Phd/YefM family antitoxin [Methylococcaceae bacterium]|nr:MAG: type II toxin-antitoxin system Phd/YefM family antitoxin [Methylococcaceae bacterium]
MIDLHPEFLSHHGKPAFAVLPIEEFDQLKAYLEDMEDLLALRQAKAAEEHAPTTGLDELRLRLGL